MSQQQQVVLQGITYEDIQRIFEKTVAECKPNKPTLLYLDIAYLYTFDVSDYLYIQKFTESMKFQQTEYRNPSQITWHTMLERWVSGEYVVIDGRPIKPLQIERTFDRVTNEFMQKIAGAMAGFGDFAPMKYHAVGDGVSAGSSPSPNDTALQSEVDRIDVTQDVGGGGMSIDGSTFMVIGNHDRFMPSADMTESGIFDRALPGTGGEEVLIVDDTMGDHSIFPGSITHLSGQDGPASTTIIYQCSS